MSDKALSGSSEWLVNLVLSLGLHIVALGALVFFSGSGSSTPAKDTASEPAASTPAAAEVPPPDAIPKNETVALPSDIRAEDVKPLPSEPPKVTDADRPAPVKTDFKVTYEDTSPAPARRKSAALKAAKTPKAKSELAAASVSPKDPAGEVLESYVVRKGESLTKIARDHGCTLQELAKLNGISPTAGLQVGQRIKVPKAE